MMYVIVASIFGMITVNVKTRQMLLIIFKTAHVAKNRWKDNKHNYYSLHLVQKDVLENLYLNIVNACVCSSKLSCP